MNADDAKACKQLYSRWENIHASDLSQLEQLADDPSSLLVKAQDLKPTRFKNVPANALGPIGTLDTGALVWRRVVVCAERSPSGYKLETPHDPQMRGVTLIEDSSSGQSKWIGEVYKDIKCEPQGLDYCRLARIQGWPSKYRDNAMTYTETVSRLNRPIHRETAQRIGEEFGGLLRKYFR